MTQVKVSKMLQKIVKATDIAEFYNTFNLSVLHCLPYVTIKQKIKNDEWEYVTTNFLIVFRQQEVVTIETPIIGQRPLRPPPMKQ